MIDYKKSAELNNTTVEELKARFVRFPQSNKRIIRVCDGCGDERETNFCDYTSLCIKCNSNLPDAREAARTIATKQYSTECAREAARLRGIDQYSTLEARNDQSKRLLQFNIDHPEAGNAHSEWMIKRFKDNPELGQNHSIKMLQYHIDNPKAGIELGEKLKVSDAHKLAVGKFCGGNDIVMHHYIYDDADLSKYTIPMTRSEHTAMHHRMAVDGYEVQHINSDTDDNGLWGYK